MLCGGLTQPSKGLKQNNSPWLFPVPICISVSLPYAVVTRQTSKEAPLCSPALPYVHNSPRQWQQASRPREWSVEWLGQLRLRKLRWWFLTEMKSKRTDAYAALLLVWGEPSACWCSVTLRQDSCSWFKRRQGKKRTLVTIEEAWRSHPADLNDPGEVSELHGGILRLLCLKPMRLTIQGYSLEGLKPTVEA